MSLPSYFRSKQLDLQGVIYQNDKNLRGRKLIVIYYLDETTSF